MTCYEFFIVLSIIFAFLTIILKNCSNNFINTGILSIVFLFIAIIGKDNLQNDCKTNKYVIAAINKAKEIVEYTEKKIMIQIKQKTEALNKELNVSNKKLLNDDEFENDDEFNDEFEK